MPLLRDSPKQQLLKNVLDFAIPWVELHLLLLRALYFLQTPKIQTG